MITPYFGEFLLSAPPLEMSMNYCSHKCAYCFANLNKPDRKAAPQEMINLLATIETRGTLVARLLREKYPVLISNKVDPFAHSNYRLTLQFLEVFAALKIPVAFQTKGGKGLAEALDLIQSSCFYFSITAADDATAKKIEPGAPSITERLAAMEMLASKGHHVWAGVNPLVKAWIPNVKDFAKRLADSGIKHVWSEVLHLSYDQVQAMSPRERENISEPVIKEAMKKHPSKENFNHMMDFIDACRESKIEFGCKHWPEFTSCLEPYRERYPKLFPSMTEFTNHANKNLRPGDEITFEDFAKFMLKDLPDFTHRELKSYIFSCNRKLGNELALEEKSTYRDILKIIWTHREHRMNPRRSFAFKRVIIGQENGDNVFKADKNGLPVIYFTGKKLQRG